MYGITAAGKLQNSLPTVDNVVKCIGVAHLFYMNGFSTNF